MEYIINDLREELVVLIIRNNFNINLRKIFSMVCKSYEQLSVSDCPRKIKYPIVTIPNISFLFETQIKLVINTVPDNRQIVVATSQGPIPTNY
jgi:hypothetical protein